MTKGPALVRLRHLLPALALAPVLHTSPAAAAPAALPSAYERQVLTLTNLQRAAYGLRPLALSTCATWYAKTWSARMANTRTFGHQDLGPVVSTCGASRGGENIAYGNVTPTQLVGMWMRSSTHRANILNPRFTKLGVGALRRADGQLFSTQDFLG